jgi:2-oxo-4-hydroxy-4-carboxy-5-ureidoimidazoline decarboxylase
VRALLDASHVAFSHLTDADLRQALAGQPRVGARLADADPGASWPPRERSGAQAADAATRHALLAGDAAYEQRFGQVFVVNASGLTGGELLHRLQVRMRNDRETERRIVREELRGITRRRLEEQFAP